MAWQSGAMTSVPVLLPFEGRSPQLDPTAWVAPGASVIGRATLGAHSSVFYGAVVRADTDAIVLGSGSNLQDNVSVHADVGVPTTIGSGVSVGHNAVLHGCTIEDDCLIGMSATVLNRSVIGAGSLVAAGTVVLEGTIVPPRSLVAGVPGKVRRPLTDDEVEHIRQNARHYLELSDAHRVAWQAQG
jgi:carbonic anhydrase/acetyltransferase-like protein (isoleucine patch superfamily)